MTHKGQQDKVSESKPNTAFRLYAMQSPEVQKSLTKLLKRYGKYAIPAQNLREMMDVALGLRTLTGELYKMREE